MWIQNEPGVGPRLVLYAGTRQTTDQVIAFETLVSTLVSLPPTLFIAVMAATAINEAMSVYSMAVAPWSFFISLRKIDSICIPEFIDVLNIERALSIRRSVPALALQPAFIQVSIEVFV